MIDNDYKNEQIKIIQTVRLMKFLTFMRFFMLPVINYSFYDCYIVKIALNFAIMEDFKGFSCF